MSMRAGEVRLAETARGCRLSSAVSSAKGSFEPFELFIEYDGIAPDRLAANGDAMVPALLWTAMKLGEPLAIDSGISAVLYENLGALQIMSEAWIPGLRQVPVEAHRRDPLPAARGSGLFFSCGVDSFYSLLKHPASVSHLLCIQGFDMTLEETAPFGRLFAATEDVARAAGLEALAVRTNMRTLTDRYFRWLDIFVAGLAAVALGAQGVLGGCSFATDTDFNHFTHRGTHPALDQLWSAENMTLVHDGYELTRLEKAARLGQSELAMRHLRVCLSDPEAYNCGRCEKCIRTMLELHAAGALGRCRTLPNTLRADDVAGVRIVVPAQAEYYRQIERALEHSAADRAYVGAIRRALWMYQARRQYYRLRGAVGRAPAGGMLLGAMDRAKQLFGAATRA